MYILKLEEGAVVGSMLNYPKTVPADLAGKYAIVEDEEYTTTGGRGPSLLCREYFSTEEEAQARLQTL